MAEVDREAMLASALRLAKLGTWAWTLGTDQLWLSPEALRILGLSEADLDGTFSSLMRRVHPDDVAEMRKIGSQMRQRQRSYSYRCRVRAADGSLRLMRGDGEAQFDASGQVCRLVGTVLDETERVETRDRLHDIAETSHEWFWEQDEHHRFTVVSGGKHWPAVGNLAAAMGKARWEIPGAMPMHSTWQAHIDLLEARKTFREFEYRVGEGPTAFVICVSGHPTYDAAGNFRGYKGSALNVTRRIQAEQQAQEKQALLERIARLGHEQQRELTERLTTTLESITDAFFTLDRDWRFTYINREAEKLIGRPREELLGQVVWQQFPTEVGRPFHVHYERALAEFTTVEFEEFSPALGLWLRVVAYPSVQGLAVYFRDVTESRRVREALEESEERYRLLFETSADAILQTTPEGSVARANPAACAMFGMTEAQLREAGRERLIDLGDARLAALLEEKARAGSASGRLTMLRGNGTRFEAEVTTSRYLASDGQVHSSVLIRDITERLAKEREIQALNQDLSRRVLQRTAELEAANGELRGFAHSLAHDLRAPVAVIDGFAGRIEDHLRGAGAERELHYLQRIRSAARRMDEYIDALLSLANISQARLRPATVDLSAVAGAILSELQEREPQRAVACRVEPGLSAQGDARLLRLALENLLGNAWKFTSQRAGATIAFGAQPGADGARVFCVRDNGVGFDMAYAGKLFGTFQRLHGESEFPGTGIGLANVSRIVARHGGRVWAESREGEGAAFFFTLGALSDEP